MKPNYYRAVVGQKQCPAGSELLHDDGKAGLACFETCENGFEREGSPNCFGGCPAGTEPCRIIGDIYFLCMDPTKNTCANYAWDITEYALRWAAAVPAANVFEIVDLITNTPEVYPVCEDWHDEEEFHFEDEEDDDEDEDEDEDEFEDEYEDDDEGNNV